MDFNIFNRVRKIKTSTTTDKAISLPGKGLKKIATSRKITPVSTSSKRQVCQTSSAESHNSSLCNTSCQSSDITQTTSNNSSNSSTNQTDNHKISPLNLLHHGKSPVAQSLSVSTVDSGLDSTYSKQKVSPQTSNTSTGSVLSGHVDMASELQRRCQQAAKLAFKEENKVKKQNIRQNLKKVEMVDDGKKDEGRRPAIDLTEVETENAAAYKKKKKKHRLQSDQTSSRVNVDKVIHRAHSSDDLCCDKPGSHQECESDNEEAQVVPSKSNGYPHYEETVQVQIFNSTSKTNNNSTTPDKNNSPKNNTKNTNTSNTSNNSSKSNTSEEKTSSSSDHDSAQVHSSEGEKKAGKANNNASNSNTRRASKGGVNQKITVVEVPAPPVKFRNPPATKEQKAQRIDKSKGAHYNLPNSSPSAANKVQPTSRRVNGVTLRDLYSLRAVLSDSDNGTVFSGRRRIDNAAVAIKRIMKSKVKRWHMIKDKSVPMEIALLRKVNETRHPGVVTLLEWFECSDCFLLVMARPTPVLDLFDFVSEKKRLDERTTRTILIQVIQAMHHCHNKVVLHRDIKLENVLVKTDNLNTTIIDFGCGTILEDILYKDFAGTPQYYPPEYYICKQYHGLPAAVWSLGVMLYAMLCGRLPFASAHEIVHLEPSWHGSFCRKINPIAKDLVESMLKKQPRRRLNMNDILKHKWLRDIKWCPQTGAVTFPEDKMEASKLAETERVKVSGGIKKSQGDGVQTNV